MRKIVLLALMALLVSSSVSANVLQEDIFYWYIDADGMQSSGRNPSTSWIAQYKQYFVVKVQQTVYDHEDTVSMLADRGYTQTVNGYLYEYSVSNKGATPITAFAVNWGAVTPELVATDEIAASAGWSGQDLIISGNHELVWKTNNSSSLSIKKGSSLGGFWAVADTYIDRETDAAVFKGQVDENNYNDMFVAVGRTTAPVTTPEPGSMLAMASGLIGLAGFIIKRK